MRVFNSRHIGDFSAQDGKSLLEPRIAELKSESQIEPPVPHSPLDDCKLLPFGVRNLTLTRRIFFVGEHALHIFVSCMTDDSSRCTDGEISIMSPFKGLAYLFAELVLWKIAADNQPIFAPWLAACR
ncbi:hypothetical protein CISG_08178 [Coccidioides immitis RMSCC 3703]|uniref:Uncharacterized protein n=2 Tax=Coccidioides immitis TaxID=5501 RepID=A0A0J8R8E7_COCIT|nr:hypothetical protein CIRG_00969 [Coccidioides immitis RMSCC 2394]KMU80018.1 hypothetical protein CISG_08178 [Coccidioides immitis RMSCC 3703]